jgi:hypothetical protein
MHSSFLCSSSIARLMKRVEFGTQKRYTWRFMAPGTSLTTSWYRTIYGEGQVRLQVNACKGGTYACKYTTLIPAGRGNDPALA